MAMSAVYCNAMITTIQKHGVLQILIIDLPAHCQSLRQLALQLPWRRQEVAALMGQHPALQKPLSGHSAGGELAPARALKVSKGNRLIPLFFLEPLSWWQHIQKIQ